VVGVGGSRGTTDHPHYSFSQEQILLPFHPTFDVPFLFQVVVVGDLGDSCLWVAIGRWRSVVRDKVVEGIVYIYIYIYI
jgi:hypothetical protein